MRLTIAKRIIVSLLRGGLSWSLLNRRYWPNQPNVRSTIQRFGNTLNLCLSVGLTISSLRPYQRLTVCTKSREYPPSAHKVLSRANQPAISADHRGRLGDMFFDRRPLLIY